VKVFVPFVVKETLSTEGFWIFRFCIITNRKSTIDNRQLTIECAKSGG